MKDRIKHSLFLLAYSALSFLCACGTIDSQQGSLTSVPTAIVQPTMTKIPTNPCYITGVTPTQPVTETPTPTSATKPTISAEPTVTEPTPEVTGIPTETVTPIMTATPTESGAMSPTPTSAPIHTVTPTTTPVVQSATSTPVITQTPTESDEEYDPLPLIENGWQNLLDISMQYYVIFPDCFDRCITMKEASRILFQYTCSTNEDIKLIISYDLEQTYESALERVRTLNGEWIKQSEDDRKATYCISSETMERGLLLESRYSAQLLGTDYLAGNGAVGVMWVMFYYPQSKMALYETDEYNFYVVKIP